MLNLNDMGARARRAARTLALTPTERKNAALEAVATALLAHADMVLAANAIDLERGRAAGLADSLLDRMLLTQARLENIAADTRNVAHLLDPVGEQFDHNVLPNGLRVHKRHVPLGVVGVIYEARPNVTVDIAALCLKSGNAAILRGGKEITSSCATLTAIIRDALAATGLPTDALQ